MHPRGLGRPAAEILAEIGTYVGPMLHGVLEGGERPGRWTSRFGSTVTGYIEESFFTYSDSPIPDDAGVGGVLLVTVRDDRARARRAAAPHTPGELAAEPPACSGRRGLHSAPPGSRRSDSDLPFGLPLSGRAARAGSAFARRPAWTEAPDPDNWPLRRGASDATGRARRGRGLRGSSRGEATRPRAALALPMAEARPDGHRGLPRGRPQRPPDGLTTRTAASSTCVAGHVATAIANAQRLRGGAAAGRGAGRARSREDRLLQQRQPRVPHAAHADARAARRRARPAEERSRPRTASGWRSPTATPCGSSSSSTRCWSSPASRPAACRRATSRPTSPPSPRELASMFRSAIERAGLRLVVDCPPLPRAGRTWTARCGRRSSSISSPTPSSSRSRARSPSRCDRSATASSCRVRDTGTGIPEQRAAAHVRAVPPHRGRAGADARGDRHRAGAGAGAGQAARRDDPGRERRRHGHDVHRSRSARARPTCRPSASARRARRPRPPCGADAFVEEALRWLPTPPTTERRSTRRPARRTRRVDAGGRAAARVLVADDNADMREYVAPAAGRSATTVEAVADGAAALAAAARAPPDLVLTDVMMPRLDGFGLLRALRADPRTATCRSSCCRRARARRPGRGAEAGADDYLVKPFGARELLARVGRPPRSSGPRSAARRRVEELSCGPSVRRAQEQAEAILESIKQYDESSK